MPQLAVAYITFRGWGSQGGTSSPGTKETGKEQVLHLHFTSLNFTTNLDLLCESCSDFDLMYGMVTSEVH